MKYVLLQNEEQTKQQKTKNLNSVEKWKFQMPEGRRPGKQEPKLKP